MRIVVTGAGRGIGLELVRQLLARGDTVEATARKTSAPLQELLAGHPQTFRVHPLELTDERSVRDFVAALAPGPIDGLINNAGASGSKAVHPLPLEDMRRLFEINVVGTLRITDALLPRLKASKGKVMTVSTRLASLTETWGERYPYRVSKTALNMAMRNLAKDLEPDGIPVLLVHPGWVKTDMGGPDAPLSAEQSVSDLVKLFDALNPALSGHFLNHDGQQIPW